MMKEIYREPNMYNNFLITVIYWEGKITCMNSIKGHWVQNIKITSFGFKWLNKCKMHVFMRKKLEYVHLNLRRDIKKTLKPEGN